MSAPTQGYGVPKAYDANTPAVRETQVQQKSNQLDGAIQHLYETVEHLEKRLLPLLRPATEQKSGIQPTESLVEFAQNLQSKCDRISSIQEQVAGIIARLEV